MKLHIIHVATPKRRKTDIIGENIPDVFFDSYIEERLVLGDILNRVDDLPGTMVNVTFDKEFLKRMVRSHLSFIKSMGKINA